MVHFRHTQPRFTLSRYLLWAAVLALAMLAAPAFAAAPKPAPVNYDEAKVGSYTLPDPLKMNDGTPVATMEDWKARRRPEILAMFQREEYGRPPRPVDDLRFKVLSVKQGALGGKATRKIVRITLARHPAWAGAELLLYIPSRATQPVPAFLGLNFKGNHAITSETDVLPPTNWVASSTIGGAAKNTVETRGSSASSWPLEMIVDRGYAVGTIWYGALEPDTPKGFETGVRAALARDGQDPDWDAKNDWGAIGAWAWGLSRALDYLETDPAIDAKKVAVLGHSRLGKTALWAGASDERFAIVISNCSGEGGAALARRNFGETIASTVNSVPFWYRARHYTWLGRENERPFDQHMLIALAAPRPVYVASATEDPWADPKGEFLSARAAEPVYALFGLKGLQGVDWKPRPDTSVGATIGYHIRTGKHAITAYDWTQYMNFADRHFGRSVS